MVLLSQQQFSDDAKVGKSQHRLMCWLFYGLTWKWHTPFLPTAHGSWLNTLLSLQIRSLGKMILALCPEKEENWIRLLIRISYWIHLIPLPLPAAFYTTSLFWFRSRWAIVRSLCFLSIPLPKPVHTLAPPLQDLQKVEILSVLFISVFSAPSNISEVRVF